MDSDEERVAQPPRKRTKRTEKGKAPAAAAKPPAARKDPAAGVEALLARCSRGELGRIARHHHHAISPHAPMLRGLWFRV